MERSASAIQALALNYTHAGNTVTHLTKQLRWTKPPQGMQKLNVDFVATENFIGPTKDAHTTEAIVLKDWSSSGAAPIIDDCFDG